MRYVFKQLIKKNYVSAFRKTFFFIISWQNDIIIPFRSLSTALIQSSF